MNGHIARIATVDDVELHFEVHGQRGPWVTLVHGGLMPSVTWLEQASGLAADARVLTFDLRGYGRSSRPPDGYDVPHFARDMVGLWNVLGIDRSVVVGFSMGGFVAMEAAIVAPERVTALMLVGTAAGLDATATEVFRRRADVVESDGLSAERDIHADRVLSESFRSANPHFMRVYRQRIDANDPRSLAATFRGLASYDRRDEVGRIGCPTLVVCGEEDAAIPVRYSEELHRAIAGSRLVKVPRSGHTVHVERPEEFARLLRRLLDDVAS